MHPKRIAVLLFLALGSARSAQAAPIVFSASGASAVDITPTVDSFRTALGALNPNVAGSFGSGRREINWDGVPAGFAGPNNLPPNFFNVNSPRGVVFSTPGTGFEVSGVPGEFGDIDPNYPSLFAPFSLPRLFTALGSTITDVNFFVPGSTNPAATSGFGAVFSDVDLANVSSLQFFDPFGNSLGIFAVPNTAGNETFSFLGVQFDAGELVGRVRITAGNQILAAGNTASDLVVMDDFIYGEPVPVPEPMSGALTLVGLAALKVARMRRRRTERGAGRSTASGQ